MSYDLNIDGRALDKDYFTVAEIEDSGGKWVKDDDRGLEYEMISITCLHAIIQPSKIQQISINNTKKLVGCLVESLIWSRTT